MAKKHDISNNATYLRISVIANIVLIIIIAIVLVIGNSTTDISDDNALEIPLNVPYGATFCGWCSGCEEHHFIWYDDLHVYHHYTHDCIDCSDESCHLNHGHCHGCGCGS